MSGNEAILTGMFWAIILFLSVGVITWLMVSHRGERTVSKDDRLDNLIMKLYDFADEYRKQTGDASLQRDIDEFVRTSGRGDR